MILKEKFHLRESILLVIILLAIPLSFFWPVWLQGKLPIPADALVGLYHPYRDYFSDRFSQGVPYKNFILTDPVLQQYPWKWLAVQDWKEIFSDVFKGSTLPRQGRTLSHLRENPYNFSGAPLLANIQAGVFYPLNLIFFLGEFSKMWTVYIILQPILVSLFMYWWLKNRSVSGIASILGAIVWAFSSFNLVWMEWGNIGHAGLYLPLALLAVDKIVKRKKDTVIPCLTRNLYRFPLKAGMTVLFWHVLLQFSLIASLLAGHWQITLYLTLATGLYALFNKKFFLFLISYFLFLVLTSFQWLPAWRLMTVSNRQVEQENVLSREGFFIKPKHLVQLVAPDFFGNPATGNYRGEWNYSEQVIYIGIIPLMLSIVAMASIVTKQIRKDVVNSTSYSILNLQRFGVMLVLIGLVFAVRNPIAEIPYRLNVPILSGLQPTRLSYLITFGLSVLAAVGLENITRSARRLPRLAFAKGGLTMTLGTSLIVIASGLGTLFLGLLIYSSKFNLADKIVSQRNLIWPVFIWGLLVVAGVTAWISRGLPRSPTLRRGPRNDGVVFLFSVFCFLFSVFDLFRFGWKFTPFSPPEYLYPVTPAIRFLQENMEPGDRYMTLDRRILPPNANIMYQLESIDGYDPIYSQDYARLITRMETGTPQDSAANFGRIVRPGNFRSPVARELGVKYVLGLNEIEDERLTKVFQEGETRIYSLEVGEY